MYPVALKAVLRAEVALLPQFLTVWTLQGAGIVLAITACALARGRRVSGHKSLCRGVELEVEGGCMGAVAI
jgi:hypothetical protein